MSTKYVFLLYWDKIAGIGVADLFVVKAFFHDHWRVKLQPDLLVVRCKLWTGFDLQWHLFALYYGEVMDGLFLSTQKDAEVALQLQREEEKKKEQAANMVYVVNLYMYLEPKNSSLKLIIP